MATLSREREIATLDILPTKTTAPVAITQLAQTEEAARRSVNGWVLNRYLADGLPKALEAFRDIIEAAKTDALPCRPQRWRTPDTRPNGEPIRSGMGTQDPNYRIITRANAFLLMFENKKAGRERLGDEEEARGIITEFGGWAEELRPVLAAKKQFDNAMQAYQAAAPERMMH